MRLEILLVLEHDVFVGFNIAHVDSVHFFSAFGVESQAIPADMREEKAAAEIQRILDGLSVFVVNSMNLYPVKHRALTESEDKKQF